jgi:hypothetical protein
MQVPVVSLGENFSVIEYFGAGMQQLDFFFFPDLMFNQVFPNLSRETVSCELYILIYPLVNVCIFYFFP